MIKIGFKKQLVKTTKNWRLWIYGSGLLGILLAFLQLQGIQTGHSGDMICGGDVVCEGEFWINVPPTVTNYLGQSVNITQLCFGKNLDIQLSEPISDGVKLYKADKRYSATNPNRWKEFSFKGNCINVGNNSFKINATKDTYATVKWGINNTEIDPLWLPIDLKDINSTVEEFYEFNSHTICVDGKCEVTIGGSYALDNDGKWKNVTEARSLKNSNIKATVIQEDKDYKVDIIDYNYTSINYKLTVLNDKELINIPVTVYNKSKVSISSKSYNFKDVTDEKIDSITFTNPYDKEIHFGKNSIILILNESNTGNIGDTYADENSPTTNRGGDYLLINCDSGARKQVFIKWNMSVIPTSAEITAANMTLTVGTAPAHARNSIGAYNTQPNGWWETGLTWNNKEALNSSTTIVAISSTGDKVWNITNITIDAEHNTTNRNLSVSVYDAGTSCVYATDTITMHHKESPTTASRPRLQIWYELGPIIPSLNQTNSTVAGETILFSTNWTVPGGVNMDSYTFNWTNGTKNIPVLTNSTIWVDTFDNWPNSSYCAGKDLNGWTECVSGEAVMVFGAITNKSTSNSTSTKIHEGSDIDTLNGSYMTKCMDLTGYTQAYLDFWYNKTTTSANSEAQFWWVNKTGTAFTVQFFTTSLAADWTYKSINLTPFISAQTCFRYMPGGASAATEKLRIDDIKIIANNPTSYIDSWVIDNPIAFSGGTWSNTSKIVNSTISSIIKWCYIVNDTTGRSNNTCTPALTNIFNTTGTILTIEHPKDTPYNSTTVWQNVTLNGTSGSWCGVSINGTANQTMNQDNNRWTLSTNLLDGAHNSVFCCNDTRGNSMNCTGNAVFSVDTNSPLYSNNATNSTNGTVNHMLNWVDYGYLSGYIFSFDNGTGSFVNDTWTNFSSVYFKYPNPNATNCTTSAGNECTASQPCANLIDNDYATSISSNAPQTARYCYMNYTKPYAILSAVWEVKDDSGTANYTVPSRCIGNDVAFRTYIEGSGAPCLEENTLIYMPDGNKKIKDLKKGDIIYSYNDGILEEDIVDDIIIRDLSLANNEYYYIYTDTEIIKSTYNHKFYTNGIYVAAENLSVGMLLLNNELKIVKINKIEIIHDNGLTYDISVNKNHNFFANNILVHNLFEGTIWSCYNGTGWENLRSSASATPTAFEESIFWFRTNYTGTSNVTKNVNSEGTKRWCVYANDSSNAWNNTGCSNPFSYSDTPVVGDTCECSSIQAGTTVDCTENCNIDSDCDANGQNIVFNGIGRIEITGQISNYVNVKILGGCIVTAKDGGGFVK